MLKFVFQNLDAIKGKAYVMTWWEKLKTTKVIKVMTDMVIYHMEYGPQLRKIRDNLKVKVTFYKSEVSIIIISLWML